MLLTINAEQTPEKIEVYTRQIEGKLVKGYFTLYNPKIVGFTYDGKLVVVAVDSPERGALMYRTEMDTYAWFWFMSQWNFRKDHINSIHHNHAFNLYWKQV